MFHKIFFSLILTTITASAIGETGFEAIANNNTYDPVREITIKYQSKSPALIELAKKAQESTAAGKREDAKRLVADIVKRYPDCSLAYLWWAEFDIEDKNWHSAVEKLSKSIELDESNRRALHLRAATYNVLKQYREALRDFSKILEASPDDVHFRALRAGVLSNAGDHNRALEELNKAVDESNRDVEILLRRAGCFLAAKNPIAAHADFREVLESTPKNADANAGMALLLTQLSRDTEAIHYWAIAIEGMPSNANWYMCRGYCRQNLGEFRDALKDYRKAVQIDPNTIKSLNSLAICLSICDDPTLRDLSEAEEVAKKSLKLSAEQSWESLQAMAIVLSQGRHFNEAIEYQDKCLAQAPKKDQDRLSNQRAAYVQGKTYAEFRKESDPRTAKSN